MNGAIPADYVIKLCNLSVLEKLVEGLWTGKYQNQTLWKNRSSENSIRLIGNMI